MAPNLHKIRKTMYFLIYLYRQCLAYFLLFAHQRPFKQSQCLLLLFANIVHFFDHCLSKFTIVLDHSLDSELCKVKQVLELRDIEIYLFLSCRLDLKFDVIDLLMKWGVWLIELLDESLEVLGGGFQDRFDRIKDWFMLFNKLFEKKRLWMLVY